MYRRLTFPIVATTLFLSAIGCSKKESAAPASNTASFQVDGTSLSSQVTATPTAGSIGTTFYDWLYLDLAVPQATQGVNRVRLLLYKVPGAPVSTYLLNNLTVYPGGYNFAGTSFTLKVEEDGSLSGSFSGRVQASSSSIPGPYTTITNGEFTRVRL